MYGLMAIGIGPVEDMFITRDIGLLPVRVLPGIEADGNLIIMDITGAEADGIDSYLIING
jgi:hypothetical protein